LNVRHTYMQFEHEISNNYNLFLNKNTNINLINTIYICSYKICIQNKSNEITILR